MGCTIDSNFFMLLCFSVCTQQHTQFRHLSRTVRHLAGRLPPRTHGDWLLHQFTLSLSQEGRLDLMLSLEIGFAWRRRLALLQTILYEKLSNKEAIREPRIFFWKAFLSTIESAHCSASAVFFYGLHMLHCNLKHACFQRIFLSYNYIHSSMRYYKHFRYII